MRRLFRALRLLGIWLDQGAAMLVSGSPDVTLSALAWERGEMRRLRGWRLARRIIDALFFFEPDHCRVAWEAELFLEQWPADMRERSDEIRSRCGEI